MEENETDWSELTHDCLVNILSRLSIKDQWRSAMFVCKSWFNVFKEPIVHSIFNLNPYFDSPSVLTKFWSPPFESKIDSMLRKIAQLSHILLTQIHIQHCTDRSIAFVAERCPNLEVLSIKNCPRVTDDSISKIAFGCPNLRELDISYCSYITHKSLVLIGRNCSNLTVLKKNRVNFFSPSAHLHFNPDRIVPDDPEAFAIAIANSMPHLEWLEIQFSRLTAKGLNLICQGCPNIEFLDLSGCTRLTNQDVVNASASLTHLKDIKKPNLFEFLSRDQREFLAWQISSMPHVPPLFM